MKLSKGFYIQDNSDLMVEVVKIGYENDRYIKAKLNLWHKRYETLYEYRSNYKLYKNKITRWKRVPNQLNPWNKKHAV